MTPLQAMFDLSFKGNTKFIFLIFSEIFHTALFVSVWFGFGKLFCGVTIPYKIFYEPFC